MKTRLFYILIILLFAGSNSIVFSQQNSSSVNMKTLVPEVRNLQNPEVRNLQIKGFPYGVQVVAVGDLCKDTKDVSGKAIDELILGSDTTLYICRVLKDSVQILFSYPFDKQVLQLKTGDADNDGKNELVLVTGYTQYTDSDVNVYIVKWVDKETDRDAVKSDNNEGNWSVTPVFTKASPRPQPLYLEIADIDNDGKNEILASYFESKYMVETVLISFNSEKPDSEKYDSTKSKAEKSGPGNWSSKVFLFERMSTAFDIGKLNYDRQGVKNSGIVETNKEILDKEISDREILTRDKNLLFVGRVYGDSIGDEGDAYILDGNIKTNLKVRRGVKSAIKVGDGNNDGKNEIYVGDGWHQNYDKIARGRLAMIGEDLTYRLIEDIKGQSNIEQIEVADIDGDGRNEVLAAGNRFFRIYRYRGDEVVGEKRGGNDEDKKDDGDDDGDDDNRWMVFKDTLFSSDTLLKPDQFAIGHINEDEVPDLVFAGKLNRRDRGVRVYNLKNLTYSGKLDKEVVTEVVNPDSLLNKPAPELLMDRWCNGSFDGIRKSSGKVIVLDFWATWCQPCKRMFPALRELQEKYRDRGLIIVGLTKVDASQSVAAIEKYVKEENFNYLMGISEETFNDLAYGVGAIPHTVLIDKKGVVRKYIVGYHEKEFLEQEILKLLEEN